MTVQEKKELLTKKMSEHLAELREDVGFTQAALGDRIGFSRYAIWAVENDNRKMNWKLYMALLCVFNRNPVCRDKMYKYGICTEAVDRYLTNSWDDSSNEEK